MKLRPQLPGRFTPFVGRETELQQVLDLIRGPSVRMVTLLGAGGIGKTRLAIEAAGTLQDQYTDGVFFVPLSRLSSIDELLPALAERLEIHLPPGGDLQEAVLYFLRDKQALLILDNFEHLLEEAALVNDILIAGPHVCVLVTSREKLGLEAENLYHLEGLKLPPQGDQEVEAYDAVRLFLQKARQVRPDFELEAANIPAVIQICRLVNGNPLGILLTAAWVEHFSPEEIFEQAKRSLDFVSSTRRDIEARHASMRAVFDSSYQRLTEHHKETFRRLAPFRGGFDLEAARAVAHTDLNALIALVDKSLLSREPGSGRYDMHALLRQYAYEELAAASEWEQGRSAHSLYYTAFAIQREPRLISREQTKALDEIQADFDNIRQALALAVERHDIPVVRAVLPSLYAYCDMRSKIYEGESLFRLASESLAPQAGETPDPAWALALLSWYDMRVYIERFESLEEIAAQAKSCLEASRWLKDPQGMAASYTLVGAIAEGRGDFKAAIHNYKQGIRAYPLLDDTYWVNMRIGLAHMKIQEHPQAVQAFESSLKRGQETGERSMIGWSLMNIGLVLLQQGNPAAAEAYLKQAGELFVELGTSVGVLWADFYLGQAAYDQGNTALAREYAQNAGKIAHQFHSTVWIRKTEQFLQRIDPHIALSTEHAGVAGEQTFSPRELEVLQLLKSELSGPDIARRLYVSLNTVRYHTKNIYQKLGVSSRLEAILKAKEIGL